MEVPTTPLRFGGLGRSITLLQHERSALLVLAGEFDVFDVDELDAACRTALAPDRPHLLVEAGEVTFLDCAFLGAVVRCAARCRARRGWMRIITASAQVRRLCLLADLDDHLVGSARGGQASRCPQPR